MDWIKQINEKLMDAESKRVFASRVLYSLTGDETHLYNLGKKFRQSVLQSQEWTNFMKMLREYESKSGLVLYGAGAFGRKMIDMTDGEQWQFVIDKNPNAEELLGIPVMKVSDYLSEGHQETIVIPSKRHYEDMRNYLMSQGVDENRIIDGTLLYDLTEGKQYFDLETLPHVDGKEVFADIGCCDGMSSVQFMKWSDGKGRCLCFEPDKHNIELVKNNMVAKGMSEDDYRLIPKGAWDEETTLSFVAAGTGASHVSGVYGGQDASDTVLIDVTTIDKALEGEDVTFIKMDIEGAELNALKGAEKTIREKKPKLAICVYHKAEDIWEIPQFILGLREDYKFYLRHYSFEASETVLYAV